MNVRSERYAEQKRHLSLRPLPLSPASMIKVKYLDLLRLHRSTRGLGPSQIARIAEHVEVLHAEHGQVIHHPDAPADALVLVVAGSLRMSIVLPGGTEKTIVYLGRDDHFGLIGLMQNEPFPVTVVADQPSILLRVPRSRAEQLVHALPLWGRNLLKALGPQLRDTFLGEKRRRIPRLVAFIHGSRDSHGVTATLTRKLMSLGEKVGLFSDHPGQLGQGPLRQESLLDSSGRALRAARLRDVVGGWPEVDRIVLDGNLDIASGQFRDLIAACEAAYCFCASDSMGQFVERLKPVMQEEPTLRAKVSMVQLLSQEERVAPITPELSEVCGNDFKLHWRGSHTGAAVCESDAGMQRLVHHLRGVSVGLALGGGAARGMAHLGVLQALESEGIAIDRMAGTSAGALTGILYAAGYTPEYLIDGFSRDLKPGLMYRMMPFGDAAYMLMKYRRGGWDSMLRRYLEFWQLEQLTLPFSSVAVDLVSAETVIRRDGDAINAMLESINLPGLARPICRDGQVLVDGGVLNVVPANVLVNQGSNVVIASDVASKILFEFGGNYPDTPTDKMRIPSRRAAMIRTRAVQDRNIRSIGGGAADLVVEPDVSHVQITDFKNAATIAQLGRVAAEEMMPQIKLALHEMDAQLFPLN
ncbi:MAG: patatin-like phospholipase family protein [Rubripirellula sp.]